MKAALKYGCLGVLGIVLLIVGALLFLAWRAEPLATTAEVLATVPEAERAALSRLCEIAGIKPEDLRHVGSHYEGTFDHPLNKRALVVTDGHIVALCLRELQFSSLPDFAGLPELLTLDFQGSSLADWPDLSPLRKLQRLNVSSTPLPDAEAGKLPPAIATLQMADTKLTNLTPFAGLSQLKVLDASHTGVTSFDALVGLSIDELKLEGTKVAALPAAVPARGGWEVNVDGSPVVAPPGYVRSLPGDGDIGQALSSDEVQGSVTKEKVEGQGRVTSVTRRRRVELPPVIVVGPPIVNLEVQIASGKALLWLREPPGFFTSPWFDRSKVKGFGLLRQPGWISQTVTPDAPVTMRGSLDVRTTDRYYEVSADIRSQPGYMQPPDWRHHGFLIEPVEGTPVGEVTFRISGQ